MSILIKGIDIPEKGYVDVRLFSDGRATTQTGDHPFFIDNLSKGIEIMEIPPHGRLIDADMLKKAVHKYDYPITCVSNSIDFGMFTVGIDRVIDEAPTVIPADSPKEERA